MRRPEQVIHRAVIQHLRMRGAPGTFACHVPNGGKRSPLEAAIMQGLGVVAGVPDIFIVRGGQLYCLELKAKGGRLSPKQIAVHEQLRAAGAVVGVATGIDEALDWLQGHGLLRPDMGRVAA